MKKIVIAALIAIVANPVIAAGDADKIQEYRDTCMIYAKDDGISSSELEEYINSCIKDFQESDTSAKD